MHGYIFTCFWLITLKLGKFVNSRPSFQQCQWIFINKSEMESCKKFVEGLTSNFIYGLNFARDISQMKQTRRLFFHIFAIFYRCVQSKCLQIYCQARLWKSQLRNSCLGDIIHWGRHYGTYWAQWVCIWSKPKGRYLTQSSSLAKGKKESRK